jgi:hypothetical protein
MSYAAAHAAIRTRMETEWSGTPVQMPKVKFDVPNTAWVRLNIDPSGAEWASMGDPGNNVERNLGQVTIQIFAPSGEGEGEALELSDNARAIFRSWRDAATGLRFEVPPYARNIGTQGKWYQINVVAPFKFDDHT